MDRILAHSNPSVGLVIGTHAALPHVHLHLETMRRNHPDVPVLVHDDASHQQPELEDLCREYGASFASRQHHAGHYVGDLSAFVTGFEWARQNGFQYLVKFSRRFIPIKPWLQEFQDLAYYTQYATYSYLCTSTGFGFRTECLAAHVPSWHEYGGVDELKATLQTGRVDDLFEAYFHRHARGVHEHNCGYNKRIEKINTKSHEVSGYGDWPMMGSARDYKMPGVLFHTANTAQEYYDAAAAVGIDRYIVEDFADPQQMNTIPLIYQSARNCYSDIGEHLEVLSRLSSLCEHVTEFGVRDGLSTAALLYGKPNKLISYDIAPFGNEKKLVRAAQREGISFTFHQRNVHEVEIEETDFLFIDDLHNYEQVKTDLAMHAHKVKKYIGFHDTTSFGDAGETAPQGIWTAIAEFVRSSPAWELMMYHTNNNGLTILRRTAGDAQN